MCKESLPNLILTASGPGEISGWVQPILREIRKQKKPWRVSLVLWRTAFSTGSKERLKALFPELDTILAIQSNFRVLFDDLGVLGTEKKRVPRALLHLGGDPLFTRLLAVRLSCPAFLYSEHGVPWYAFGFRRVFISRKTRINTNLSAGNVKGRLQFVGDLFLDAMEGRNTGIDFQKRASAEAPVTIGLFPGSRPYQIKYMAPLFLQLSKRIAKKVGNVTFFIAKSEYLSNRTFIRAAEGRRYVISPGGKAFYLTSHGATDSAEKHTVPILTSKEVFSRADMAVMLPGTATAEGMISRIPMVVLAPYYRLGSNPSPGVPPIMDSVLNLLGKCIKRNILLFVLNRFTFFSHPNILAGREIIPELRGWIKPSEIVETVAEMARNKAWRERISRELRGLAGPPGAAMRIINALDPFLE